MSRSMQRRPGLEIFGFPLRVHPTAVFLILLLSFAFRGAGRNGASMAIMAFVVIVVSILVHELGHAFVARRMGLGPVEIMLHGFGGLASFSKRPTNKQGFLVSIAGPLAGLTLGAIAWLIEPVMVKEGSHFLVAFGIGLLIWINIFWSLFNLLPMYPLDGGQVMWHALALKMSPYRARLITRQVSLATAAVIGVYALLQGWIFIALVCLFVYSENAKVRS